VELKCSIRLSGDRLDPREVSAALGIAPTEAREKGDPTPTRHATRVGKQPTGVWILDAPAPMAATVEPALKWAVDTLASLPKPASTLPTVEHVDVILGVFGSGGNAGIEVSPNLLAAISANGAGLFVDVYT